VIGDLCLRRAARLFVSDTVRRLPRSPLYPYTTLFRSASHDHRSPCRSWTRPARQSGRSHRESVPWSPHCPHPPIRVKDDLKIRRSEEHTSELQSRENLVCRLLLEKKTELIGRERRAGA